VAALLDNSGGRNNERGVWLLASHADILQREGRLQDALTFAQQAADLAFEVVGPFHPCAGVCRLNIADIACDMASYEAANEQLEWAVTILSAATPDKDYTAAYLKSVLDAASG